MNATENNVTHIYEIVLYAVHDDGLLGFHRIPKNNGDPVST
jgi:hypothetical protein